MGTLRRLERQVHIAVLGETARRRIQETRKPLDNGETRAPPQGARWCRARRRCEGDRDVDAEDIDSRESVDPNRRARPSWRYWFACC